MTALASTQSPWRRLATIVFPQGRGAAGAPSLSDWLLHGVFWGGFLLFAWQLNRGVTLQRWLRSPWPMLHQAWLPLLTALVYSLSWLVGALWNALRRPDPGIAYRDIESAWNDVWEHLAVSRQDAMDLPLFLVLGPCNSETKAMLEATGGAEVLPSAAAPFQVVANAKAIFVVGGALSRVGRPIKRGPSAGERADREHETTARLLQLCRLMARARPGPRTLQGIIVVTPLQTLADDEQTREAVASCQADLRVIRHATGLESPLYFTIVGLDERGQFSFSHIHQNAGDSPANPRSGECGYGRIADTYLDPLPQGATEGWYRRFPLMPDGEPEEFARALRREVNRLCADRIPPLVRRALQLDLGPGTPGELTETLRENIRQHQFLLSAQAWQARLCRLVTEGTSNDFAEPGLVAGCYFLPSVSRRESPVLQALWTDLLSHQHAATWTPESWFQSERLAQITRRGYGLVLTGWLGIALIAIRLMVYRV